MEYEPDPRKETPPQEPAHAPDEAPWEEEPWSEEDWEGEEEDTGEEEEDPRQQEEFQRWLDDL